MISYGYKFVAKRERERECSSRLVREKKNLYISDDFNLKDDLESSRKQLKSDSIEMRRFEQ